ncbi:hypothetical protein [Aurantimonas sp. Leaf443]|uniref:hypothetical protein n=1 Tax=Aurantimonas sp. Leaf443 TaxID=1736378 RepID=UPI0006FCAE07|nr:hypothetical protein [Aurantimonas sp. Leaf443]KQT86289.1 hypothetical protein ASG48_06935 [Aurantimonas sp. Leaf443]
MNKSLAPHETTGNASPGRDPSLDDLRTSVMDVVEIHNQMIQRLLNDETDLMALAEFLDDVGNRYLDFSEQISAHHSRLNIRRIAESL